MLGFGEKGGKDQGGGEEGAGLHSPLVPMPLKVCLIIISSLDKQSTVHGDNRLPSALDELLRSTRQ